MLSPTTDNISNFVATFVGLSPEKISPSTSLFGDLGVDGDDGDELMTEFGQRFNVDLSALDLTKHFGTEGFWPWASFYWLYLWWRRGTPEQRAGLLPITISDLVRAAESGKWSYTQSRNENGSR